MQAQGAPTDIHACAVGLMEVRGTTRFAHGSTCTDWKPWKRIESTECFPDEVITVLCIVDYKVFLNGFFFLTAYTLALFHSVLPPNLTNQVNPHDKPSG